jgi:hypothetical protein
MRCLLTARLRKIATEDGLLHFPKRLLTRRHVNGVQPCGGLARLLRPPLPTKYPSRWPLSLPTPFNPPPFWPFAPLSSLFLPSAVICSVFSSKIVWVLCPCALRRRHPLRQPPPPIPNGTPCDSNCPPSAQFTNTLIACHELGWQTSLVHASRQ